MRVRRKNVLVPPRGGFTLTELLIVLLLIGILSGLMLAEMGGTFQDALLRSSAREVMSGLGLASSHAVSLNQAHSFTFDHGKNAFAVQRKDAGSKEGEEQPRSETRQIDERIKIQIRDPADVPEEEGETAPPEDPKAERDVIMFYPDGTADRREIVLRDRDNVELVLRINPITGRVRIAENE